jgi:predicted Rossmann fold nucleotide-binding protein DprA/Smf involved in DNA uptake
MEELPDDQRRIISVISGGDTLVDDIITSTGLAPARVLSQLTVLEIKGLIERLPGRRIALKANTAKK